MDVEYTFYQLRTKTGDGDVAFFVEKEGFTLQEIVDYAEENELNLENFDIAEIDWQERSVYLDEIPTKGGE
jgi:hypothetical protein